MGDSTNGDGDADDGEAVSGRSATDAGDGEAVSGRSATDAGDGEAVSGRSATDAGGEATATDASTDAAGSDASKMDASSEATDTASEASGDAVDPVAVTREHPVLLFDGVCNLCNGSIQFVIERDPEAQFRFAPLQSAVAQQLLRECDYEGATLDSVILVEDGECYTKSDAVIRATRHLGLPYSLLRPFGVVPSRLRNVFYDFVAERRYRWFGKREQCMMPTPDLERRFLAGGPGPDGD